ncbi:hypothetical protein E2562_027055 [Oryza meyeriana var. granulata]|uniref:Uncharacterized protein n=1 Tax=Oryza meyeriana var. granulata TaxID=110450 RepID=A0A6G1C9K5_9ORYZ|nr:hypothetical protein E2562_027055 [Oryza meyeriana var. granulata]KAF0896712.1 hypothetical protein E2562_027055 [Oryza meyeriana var. granulata]
MEPPSPAAATTFRHRRPQPDPDRAYSTRPAAEPCLGLADSAAWACRAGMPLAPRPAPRHGARWLPWRGGRWRTVSPSGAGWRARASSGLRTALVKVVTSCAADVCARLVFDGMPDRDLLSWGVMLDWQLSLTQNHEEALLPFFMASRDQELSLIK